VLETRLHGARRKPWNPLRHFPFSTSYLNSGTPSFRSERDVLLTFDSVWHTRLSRCPVSVRPSCDVGDSIERRLPDTTSVPTWFSLAAMDFFHLTFFPEKRTEDDVLLSATNFRARRVSCFPPGFSAASSPNFLLAASLPIVVCPR